MKRIVAILIGLVLMSCESPNQREINESLDRINKSLDKQIEDISTKSGKIVKEQVTSTIYNSKGVTIRHGDKNYTIDEYVHVKMEWAYFEGQKEAIRGDVRISNTTGCWEWTKSPWNGQELKTVLYIPECKDSDKTVKEIMGCDLDTIEVVEEYDIYDTEF